MKATRRRFMAMLGVGAASTPLAAKAAIETEVMALTRTSIAAGAVGSLAGGGAAPCGNENYNSSLIAASDYVRLVGLPEAMQARLWDEANWIDRLDPDIACKRSWSMAVKFATQRQRNYERSLKRMMNAGWQQRGRDALKAALGFDWPW